MALADQQQVRGGQGRAEPVGGQVVDPVHPAPSMHAAPGESPAGVQLLSQPSAPCPVTEDDEAQRRMRRPAAARLLLEQSRGLEHGRQVLAAAHVGGEHLDPAGRPAQRHPGGPPLWGRGVVRGEIDPVRSRTIRSCGTP